MEWECGGGAILIFLLTSFTGVQHHIAQGANIIFFIPTCIISIIINLKKKNIEIKTALIVVIFGIFGAIIGSIISVNIEVDTLKKCFGYFLLLIAFWEIYSLIKSYIKNKKDNNSSIKNRK